MRRRELLKSVVPVVAGVGWPGAAAAMVRGAADGPPATGRAYWVAQLERVAGPVLEALAAGQLKARMPVECAAGMESTRRRTTYLEAVGRLLSGIAPWLEHGPEAGAEGEVRRRYVALAQQGLERGLDPGSADALEFGAEPQNVVDAAFLSLGLLRAPKVLTAAMSAKTKANLVAGLRATRKFPIPFNNWLLFAACNEAALHAMGEEWDRARVEFALREHESWYVGDGVYGDGPRYHADYYDSFVIHPFLLAVLEEMKGESKAWAALLDQERERARRYAAIQERMIAPDGTYPVVGRSITYRCGAFHLLADVALRRELPEGVRPEQVRCALAAAMARTLGAPGSFDAKGWLTIGLAGHQPSLGETYISTGSLYLCADVFLPLGLAVEDAFWSGGDAKWTSQRVWGGENLPADHAIEG